MAIAPGTSTTASSGRRPRSGDDFGANDWLLEEMYERFTADPSSVDASWADYFAAHGAPGDGRGPSDSGEAGRRGSSSNGALRGDAPPRRARRLRATRGTPTSSSGAGAPATTRSRRAGPAPARGRRPDQPRRPRARPPRPAARRQPTVEKPTQAKEGRPTAPGAPWRRPRRPAEPVRPSRGRQRGADAHDAARRAGAHGQEHGRVAEHPDGDQRPLAAGQAAHRPAHRDQQPPAAQPRRQGLVHAPDRLRDGPGAQERPGHEQQLRRRQRQADDGRAGPHQPRPGHRPAPARRHPPAAGPQHQELRDARLRAVLGGVRDDGRQGPQRASSPSPTSPARPSP